MPVFELTPTLSGRVRAFVRAQLPLLLGALFVFAEGLWALPDVATSASALSGFTLIALVSLLFWVLPRAWWSTSSMLAIAVADIIGVALIRLAYFDRLPSVGMLAVFPVVWLAYAFPRWAIGVAIAGSFFITLLPVLVDEPLPSNAVEVASVITLPVLMTGLAIAVGVAARQLAISQRQLRATNLELQSSLRQARDSDRLSRSLFESVEVALAFYDTDQRLVMANTLAEQAVAAAGFQLDEPPYAGPHVRRPDNRTPIPYDEQIVPRALRGDLENHEMEWIGASGYQRAIIANAQQVLRADGTVWGTLVAAHDVTELARSMRVKDEFITTVSHELRTPLTSILGYLELLSDELTEKLTDQSTDRTAAERETSSTQDATGDTSAVVVLNRRFVTDTVDRIKRSALNLQRRIQQLLDTADRRRALQLVPTDVALLAERVVLACATQAQTSGLDLRVITTRPEWATIDAAKFEQVIENLVSNAIKYTPAPGDVTVTVTGNDERVEISVADTGVGMTSDEIDQAFDPFWRAEHVRDAQVQGIGIGLGLVRDICEAHHAPVTIRSEPSQGTTVTVRLPRHF